MGFRDSGGREEEVGRRAGGLESWNSLGKSKGTEDWHSWVLQGI